MSRVPFDDDLEMTCPRCATPTDGPLLRPLPRPVANSSRATIGSGEAHQPESADYEPKMNVTPNRGGHQGLGPAGPA